VALTSDITTRSNSQIFLVLIHLVRVAIFLEFAALMWYDAITWRPIPPIPGGPVVAQFRPLWPTILMTAVVILRIFLTRFIWFRRDSRLIYASTADCLEIGVVLGIWGIQILFYGLSLGALLVLFILILSFSSLILSLFIALRGESKTKIPKAVI
jgi:hypothetical protein